MIRALSRPHYALPRLSVRRLMVCVAGFAFLIFMILNIYSFLNDLFFEYYYITNAPVRRAWSVGPSPSVTVDVFEGSITVVPGVDGEVVAEIVTSVGTKESREVGEQARKTLNWGFHRWGNSIRITARGLSKPAINHEIHVKLSVPRGIDLDIRTGRGNIYIGQSYRNGACVRTPVSASSIRATNASDFRLSFAQGSIEVAALAPPQTVGSPSRPTLLRLDAPGRIDVIAEYAVVAARAWHGNPPSQSQEAYEVVEDEGIISFEGSLANGIHSLHAAHRISMKLRGASFPRIEAEAGFGRIIGDLLPQQVESTMGRARWVGSIGPEQYGILQLRTDSGPIDLHKDPK